MPVLENVLDSAWSANRSVGGSAGRSVSRVRPPVSRCVLPSLPGALRPPSAPVRGRVSRAVETGPGRRWRAADRAGGGSGAAARGRLGNL